MMSMDPRSHSDEDDSSGEDDTHSQSDDSDTAITTNHSETYEVWSNTLDTLFDPVDERNVAQRDVGLDTTPPDRYIRDYSTYPSNCFSLFPTSILMFGILVRVSSTISDTGADWLALALRCMVLLSYRVLTDPNSLIRLSFDFLLSEEDVDSAFDSVLTHRSSYLTPGQGVCGVPTLHP